MMIVMFGIDLDYTLSGLIYVFNAIMPGPLQLIDYAPLGLCMVLTMTYLVWKGIFPYPGLLEYVPLGLYMVLTLTVPGLEAPKGYNFIAQAISLGGVNVKL